MTHASPTPKSAEVYALSLQEAASGSHEYRTLDWIARRVAEICNLPYAGVRRLHEARGGFAVPDDTLTVAQAEALGVGDALLGGVVPFAFVATKVVSHPLVAPDAAAPPGWNAALRPERATLPGYAVFSAEDARIACARLLPLGPVRAKPAGARGSEGHRRLREEADCEAFLRACEADNVLAHHGAVLELDLPQARSYSIGEVQLAGVRIAYAGRQHDTRDARGRPAYGGSTLMVVRGGLDALAEQVRTPALSLAVALAREYDAAVRAAYPGMLHTRCNYDAVLGSDARGVARAGVLEQSWRIGGATPAELGAIEAFQRDPALNRVLACTRERHGAACLPRGAEIICRTDDPRIGPITKYRTVRFHGSQTFHARNRG